LPTRTSYSELQRVSSSAIRAISRQLSAFVFG
jgi:hypothetical protein